MSSSSDDDDDDDDKDEYDDDNTKDEDNDETLNALNDQLTTENVRLRDLVKEYRIRIQDLTAELQSYKRNVRLGAIISGTGKMQTYPIKYQLG